MVALETPLVFSKYAVTVVWLAVWRPVRDLFRTILRSHPVRIFTYHRVTDLCRDGMSITPDGFDAQLRFIQRHHEVVDFDTAMSLIVRGARLDRPVATITFDDGYRSVFTDAFPILRRLGMVGAVFVCPGIVTRQGRFQHDDDNPAKLWLRVMDWVTLRALRDAGWYIGAHSDSHARLSTLRGEPLLAELRTPQLALRDNVYDRPVALAVPFGGPDDISLEGVDAARGCGYTAVLHDYGGENFPGETSTFACQRIDVGGQHDPLMWKALVHGLNRNGFRKIRTIVSYTPTWRIRHTPPTHSGVVTG